ncbi:low affinity immunoglobulin gamma Fc region receptor II-like [Centropristis striata]|uniref:low affinity immunoglobulin gamma Fc region receptor II-like n=1 Tax=Centropristis striata TaxID=184440 RepID=UPI0027DF2AF3|nr:low affinity immunoglobulin gamma Fc region receptor II-like [Centropristis striata]
MLEFSLLNTLTSDAAFLRITPDRQQHFQYESVSLHCDGTADSTRITGTRNTEEFIPLCDIKRTSKGSSCKIERIYPADSGEYWCETGGGERSNRVNITVADGSVILESPVLPVMEGESVTLSCRNKTTSTNLSADFFKDGHLIMESSSAETTIQNVSKSDEGLYKCSISGGGESPESWLAVRVNKHPAIPSSPGEDSPSDDSDSSHLLILCGAVTIFFMALVLLLVGLLYIKKHRACGEDAADDSDSLTYTVVFTKPRKAKDEEDDSFQPIYSALAMNETPQALQHGLY